MEPAGRYVFCSHNSFLRFTLIILFSLCLTGCKSCRHNSNDADTSSNDQGSSTPPEAVYSWHTEDWEACSAACGDGTQKRLVYCRDQAGNTVADDLCPSPKPDSEKTCNTAACPPTYNWNVNNCTECALVDGRCQKTCEVYCLSSDGNRVDDAFCPDTKPAAEISCTESVCVDAAAETYGWVTFPYGDCSEACGGGKQYRAVVCAKRSNGQYVDEALCDLSTKPVMEKDCNLLPCSGCDSRISEQPDYWPTSGWQTAPLESHGFLAGAFDDLNSDLAIDLPFVTSLMVVRDGYILHEYYQTPFNADTPHSVFSVTSSISSLTFGAAWQNGLIDASALSTTVDEAFSNLITDLAADDARRDISLADALQMRTGLEWNENDILSPTNPLLNPDPACLNDDTVYLCSILRMPLAYPPGTVWNLSQHDSYLASAFFYYFTSQSLRDYANQHMFSLIGITFDTSYWLNIPTTPTNTAYTYGNSGLVLNTRDMARLGLLTLYDGCWSGQQVLAYDWLQLTQVPIGQGLALTELDGNLDFLPPQVTDIKYGLHWWLTTGPLFSGASVINAKGMGGQFIYVFKDMEMVIVTTSDVQGRPPGPANDNQRDSIWDFLQINIMNKMLDGTMVDVIDVAGDWTGTNPAICSNPFIMNITNDKLSFTCNGTTQTGNIVRCRNAENYFVWHRPDGSFIRFSWVDETLTPVRFNIHAPAGDLTTATEAPMFLSVDMTKIS